MTFGVAALGAILRVDVRDDDLHHTVRHLLADLSGPPQDRPDAAVTVTGRLPWTVLSPLGTTVAGTRPEALSATLTAVNLTAVAATPALACHCAVLHRDGVLTVLPAASGTGKSTLTAALLQRGWGYVSDEALCVDWDAGRWVPYRRPLALSGWSRGAIGAPDGAPGVDEHYYRADDLRADDARWSRGAPAPAAPRLVPGHVVLLERARGAPALEPVHRSDVLAELLRRSFTAHRDVPRALQALGDIVRRSQAWRLRLGDPAATADLLSSRLVPPG